MAPSHTESLVEGINVTEFDNDMSYGFNPIGGTQVSSVICPTKLDRYNQDCSEICISEQSSDPLKKYLKSKVSIIIDTLEKDRYQHPPVHETLLLDVQERTDEYPLPNPEETWWMDGEIGQPIEKSDILLNLEANLLDSKTAVKPDHPRTIIEICTKTMKITERAQLRGWKTYAPITIETGFDLLTTSGRQKAMTMLRKLKPDVIIAEWMCDPWSQMQNINISKGGLTAENIMEKRRIHTHLLHWLAYVERWQTSRGAHWVGENPYTAASWRQPALQAMLKRNWNTISDLCNWNLKDPASGEHYRKRTRLNTSSYFVYEQMNQMCKGTHAHQPIEGQTKVQLTRNGPWVTMNRSVFAGWYTTSFCDAILQALETEFACEEQTRNVQKDFWTKLGDYWYRHHVVPRKPLYMPEQPLSSQLGSDRLTTVNFTTIVQKQPLVVRDYWRGCLEPHAGPLYNGTPGHEWTGVTRFRHAPPKKTLHSSSPILMFPNKMYRCEKRLKYMSSENYLRHFHMPKCDPKRYGELVSKRRRLDEISGTRDYWQHTSMCWIRYHVEPRTALYAVTSDDRLAPDVNTLLSNRFTSVLYEDGSTEAFEDVGGVRDLSQPWTGFTVFWKKSVKRKLPKDNNPAPSKESRPTPKIGKDNNPSLSGPDPNFGTSASLDTGIPLENPADVSHEPVVAPESSAEVPTGSFENKRKIARDIVSIESLLKKLKRKSVIQDKHPLPSQERIGSSGDYLRRLLLDHMQGGHRELAV